MSRPPPVGGRWDPKAEAVRLWGSLPCGSVSTAPEGSPEFFAAVDRERYEAYAPWMAGAIPFGGFRGHRVLEVGCGMGTDLARFCRGGAVGIGLDLVPRHLGIAAARLRHEGHPARVVRGDAEALPVRDASLNAVYSFGVLHHTPRIQAALDEIWRVLVPGGTAIIGLYHRHSVFHLLNTMLVTGVLKGGLVRRGYRRLMADIEWGGRSDAMPLVRVYSRRQVASLLARFRDVTVRTHGLAAGHFSHLERVLQRVPPRVFEAWGHRWGWYLLATARK